MFIDEIHIPSRQNLGHSGSMADFGEEKRHLIICRRILRSVFENWQCLWARVPPPDVVLVKKSRVFVLELTVCHESNLLKSKLYKLNKYENIKQHLKPEHSHSTVELFTLEISVLGFVSDLSEFCKSLKLPKLPKYVHDSLIRSAIYSSHNIYTVLGIPNPPNFFGW